MKKIIIAETILKTVSGSDTLFERGGIVLLRARTSEDILAIHRQKRADLIITDFSLPVMDGAQLCAAVRNDEGLRDVSIILACDEAMAAAPACRDAGANAVIVNPVEPFSLFAKMSELLVVPQRKDMRVLMRVSVNGGRGSSPFFATSENISLSGMLFETNYRFKHGDQITCSFFVGHSQVNLEGTIMRVDPASSGMSRYGVRFLNPPTKALIVIEQFVKRQTQGEEPEQ